MKDIELAKLFGLPTSTITDWKNKKNLNKDVKFLLYKFISTLPDEMVKERVEAIKLLEDIQVIGRKEFISSIFENAKQFEILDGYEIVNEEKDLSSLNELPFTQRNKLQALKNKDNEFIFLQFYTPYNSNSLKRIEYLEKDYKKLNEKFSINKIYLVLSGVDIDKIYDPNFCESINNLKIMDAQYFTSKLYHRKNIVFWNEPN